MVELTKLNGEPMFLNEAWIESVEALPDTTITLHSGNKVVVLEKMAQLMEKIVRWQAGPRSGRKPARTTQGRRGRR